MKIALSTLSCPEWDLRMICQRGSEYGYDGIDFRGLLDQIDVSRTPQFDDFLDVTTEKIDSVGLEVSALSSSIWICDRDRRDENLSEAGRLLRIAREANVEYVRVFGEGDPECHSRGELAEIGRETMEEILSLPGARSVTWVVETHDNWTNPSDCIQLIEEIDDEQVGVLWDIGHTSRVEREAPAETFATIGDRLEYVHLKDAVHDPDHPVAMDDGWRYVIPGTGELPLAEGLHLLQDRDYSGWVAFEHEKRWHPELPPPEEACPEFVTWFESVTSE